MVVWEIENHVTGDTGNIQAPSKEEMIKTLEAKGYRLVCDSYYVGINSDKQEMSVMPAMINHVSAVVFVTQPITTNSKGES